MKRDTHDPGSWSTSRYWPTRRDISITILISSSNEATTSHDTRTSTAAEDCPAAAKSTRSTAGYTSSRIGGSRFRCLLVKTCSFLLLPCRDTERYILALSTSINNRCYGKPTLLSKVYAPQNYPASSVSHSTEWTDECDRRRLFTECVGLKFASFRKSHVLGEDQHDPSRGRCR